MFVPHLYCHFLESLFKKVPNLHFNINEAVALMPLDLDPAAACNYSLSNIMEVMACTCMPPYYTNNSYSFAIRYFNCKGSGLAEIQLPELDLQRQPA